MRLRTYYTCAIVIPLAAIAAVAAAGGADGPSTTGLGPGATVRWLLPPAAVRDLVLGTGICLWLLWKLYRRPTEQFQRAIWQAPGLMVVLDALLPTVVVLGSGVAREIVAEQGGLIVLRLLVRAAVGYGYVGLVQWVRAQLQLRDALSIDR
jgi:hypothetical protein